jgi:FkbM family methyltransferase
VERSGRRNIKVVDCAVSAPGTDAVPFYMPPMDHFGMGSSAPQFSVTPVSVQAKTIDTILKEFGLMESGAGAVTALKIDIEGYEAHAFLGGEKFLRVRPAPIVLFEFNDWAEERAFPGRCGWAQQILMDFGYKLWTIGDYLRQAPPLTAPLREGSHSMVATVVATG